MSKFKDFVILLLIWICVLHIGVCYKNEVEITPAPTEEATTPKSGFFSGIKNFFRGSPTTTTTTTTTTAIPFVQRPPALTISQTPLMPLGPRPDTPLSSPGDNRHQQQPVWPQVGTSTITSTTARPHSSTLPHQPQGVGSNQNQRPGLAPNLPPGFTPYNPGRPQPSGFDLSYGGGSISGRPNSKQPGAGLTPLPSSTTTTTTTTTLRPIQPQQPQQPHMGIDLRFGSTTTTMRSPTSTKEDFPALPAPRRPSTEARENFPALPTPKSPVPTPNLPSRSPSPSAWSTTPIPPRQGAVNPIGNRVSFIPSTGSTTTLRPGTQSTGGNSLAGDEEIRQLTENLYTKETNSQLGLIQVNIQGKTRSIDSGDEAPNPLLTVDERALQPPTIATMRLLFNNYDMDTLVNEYVTPNERKEENEFLDAVMATSVMREAMIFLQGKGLVTPDPKTHRDLVKELWFTQYSRGSGKIGSSGFEHVFVNEVKNGTIIGLHNWVYFYEEERAGRLDYKGYMNHLDLGTKAKVIKARFTHNGLNKPVNTLFVGTSPELELALYTVCFKLRPDSTCPVSLGNSKFGIIVYSWRYRGKSLIGSAYPEI